MENLTLLIPAKNEASCLPKVLEELKNYNCKKLVVLDPEDFETHNSVKNQNCEIYIQKKTGFGNAIIEGIDNIKTEYLCIFNADGSFDPKILNLMINLNRNENDFIFASRYIKGGGSEDDTLITFVGNKLFTFLGNLFFNLKISDILYTHIMGKSSAFKSLKLKNFDFRICIEIPIVMKKMGFKYASIPSFERKRISGVKKVNALFDGTLILFEIIKLLFRSKEN